MSEPTSLPETTIAIDDGDRIALGAETALDEVYGALADERRRQVVSTLTHESVPIDVETLARRVTVREACADTAMVTEERIREVCLSLYHHHLPKLADVGLIEYDTEEKVVEGLADAVDPVNV